MSDKVFSLPSQPGIQRDGTTLDNNFFNDGQWVRFQRNRPKKIGGFKEANAVLPEIQRGSLVFMNDTIVYCYSFGKNKANLVKTTQNAPTAGLSSTTLPALADDDIYTFQTASIFDALGTASSVVLVHGAKNIQDIASITNTPVCLAKAGDDPPVFTPVDDGVGGQIEVSGGVTVLQPFVFAYGNNGLIKNSNSNNPNDWRMDQGGAANEVNVDASKIVKGLPYRAGGASPGGLFWSLESLIRVTYASGSNFRYDIISAQASILSPASVIEYDNIYFWIGIDRFMMFDGTVRELPNSQNLNWFFDNVNFNARTKVWAIKVPRFGEIWWFFPFGDAVECTHAIIFNINLKCWYDVELGRASGYYSQVFHYPVMYSNTPNKAGKYSMFVHEFGRNAVMDYQEHAIPTWFETSGIDLSDGGVVGGEGQTTNSWTCLERVEPDFILDGPLNMTVKTNKFAHSPVEEYGPYPILEGTEKVDLRVQGRNMRLKFMSNIVNGHFEMGRLKLHLTPGDNRS